MQLHKPRVRRVVVAAAATLLGVLAALTACYTDITQQYGAPGSLDLQHFPDPPDAPPLGCEGGVPGPQKDGGCAVSWKNTIFPKLQATGPWKCGNGPSCHGADRAPQVTGDPNQTYQNFTGYKLTIKGTPTNYVGTGPGSLSPAESAILCNLKIDGVCGVTMPTGTTITCGQDVNDLRAWLGCGSPNN